MGKMRGIRSLMESRRGEAIVRRARARGSARRFRLQLCVPRLPPALKRRSSLPAVRCEGAMGTRRGASSLMTSLSFAAVESGRCTSGLRQIASQATGGNGASGYYEPSDTIKKIVTATPQPVFSFSPCKTKVLLLQRPPSNPPISEFVREEVKLAGARIDPQRRTASKMSSYTGMSIVQLEAGPL